MAKLARPYNAAEAAGDFPWDLYEDGWNGRSLKRNNTVTSSKKNGNKDVIYSHESYAQDMYNALSGIKVDGNKELKKNVLVSISDINPIDDNTILITINGGANNIIVDLNKEQKFFNQFSVGDQKMDKTLFNESIRNPKFKADLLSMDLTAKVGSDKEKASIYDGYVEKLSRELKEQISKNNKAYWATILSTNRGGFVVEVSDTIKAFMPGSMAAANRITDFESYIGKRMEVMVESWDPTYGFVVSRKKYLKTILPIKINNVIDELKDNQDKVFTGHVTGTTPFGVFVELDEYLTGMLHKTLVKDETREAMRNNSITAGTEINVYIHKIEGNRIILSDVPSAERDAVIARREAEEESEKKSREDSSK